MAFRKRPGLIRTLEFVVARPPLATLTVGVSIILLLILIDYLTGYMAGLQYFRYLVPFIPPYFITNVARRVNSRQAEYNFVADAEPVIMVGYATSPRLTDLLNTIPEAISDSSARHLGLPVSQILDSPILLPERFSEELRMEVFQRLLSAPPEEGNRRVLRSIRVQTLPGAAGEENVRFILNAVLKPQAHKWKVQLTLVPMPDEAL